MQIAQILFELKLINKIIKCDDKLLKYLIIILYIMELNLEKYSELLGLPSSFFEEHRKNFFNNLKEHYPELNKKSLIIFEGGKLEPFYSSDCFYYFFDQESNFYYLSGVREPNMKLVIDISKEETILFYEQEPDDYKTWMVVYSREEIESKFKITTKMMSEFNSYLQSKNLDKIYILEGINQHSGLKVHSPKLEFVNSFSSLNALICRDETIYSILCQTRLTKTSNELNLIKYITDISNQAILEVIKAMKPGLYEHDIENIYLNYLRTKYHLRFSAFNSSCASGKNTAYRKYDLNNRKMEEGDLFVAHLGARFCGYTSDSSITLPVSGKFSNRQKLIYNIVLQTNKEVVKSIQSGVSSINQLNTLAHYFILNGLKEIGMVKPDSDVNEMVKSGLGKIFMPHTIGYSLGLDAHDVGLNENELIQCGVILTIEPGIYFIDSLMNEALNNPLHCKYLSENCFNSFRGFGGIRISDTVEITKTEIINYHINMPKTIQSIELLMQIKEATNQTGNTIQSKPNKI